MNSSSDHKKVNLSELKSVLLDFTINFLLEPPSTDIILFGYAYFTKMKDERLKKQGYISPEGSLLEDEFPTVNISSRRYSVFAEAYNPEEDDDSELTLYEKTVAQRQELTESVKNILIFRSLEPREMSQVLDSMFNVVVNPGDMVIKQGDDGDNFYVIESGNYEASIQLPSGEKKVIHTYRNKGSFGELALMYNMPRAATVISLNGGSLWAMDRVTFRKIVLKSAFKKRKMHEELIDKVPLLKALEPYERMNLADALEPKNYDDGDLIIRQGEAADGMYFVEEGSVRITIWDDLHGDVRIKDVEVGEYFGELALLTHRPRAASAHAVGKVKLAFLDVDTFERLLGPCLDILKRNITTYECQLKTIFGSKHNVADIR